jgi:hypothetical protein
VRPTAAASSLHRCDRKDFGRGWRCVESEIDMRDGCVRRDHDMNLQAEPKYSGYDDRMDYERNNIGCFGTLVLERV